MGNCLNSQVKFVFRLYLFGFLPFFLNMSEQELKNASEYRPLTKYGARASPALTVNANNGQVEQNMRVKVIITINLTHNLFMHINRCLRTWQKHLQ